MSKRYAVYFTREAPAKRLGTVTAPDRQAAIIKAIERYGIPETSELRLDLVTKPKSRSLVTTKFGGASAQSKPRQPSISVRCLPPMKSRRSKRLRRNST